MANSPIQLDELRVATPCPMQWEQIARAATVVFAIASSLYGVAIGQTPSHKDECKPQIKISRKVVEPSKGQPFISGTVVDINGAMITGAEIRITDLRTNKIFKVTSDSEGRFKVEGLATGNYAAKIQADGFKIFESKSMRLEKDQSIDLGVTLLVKDSEELVGVVATGPSLIDTPPATTIITEDMIRSLPRP